MTTATLATPPRRGWASALSGPRSGRPVQTPRTNRPSAITALVGTLVLALFASVPALGAIPLSTPVPTATAPSAATSLATDTLSRIALLEGALRNTPTNAKAWTDLGRAYVRRAYETGDPTFYGLADRSFTMATRQRGDAVLITLGRSGLALARHDFPRAHRLAEEVLTARPDSIEGLINRTDANVELGRYGEATADVETLLDRSPGVAALARLSYVRQLNGDLPGALVAMRQAVSAAGGGGVDRAVARTYLGDILLEKGDLPGARRAYDLALTDDARLPIAIIGQARTLAATGGTAKAVSLLQALTARFPTPGALILLADRQRADGDAKAAADTDEIVRATEKLFEANGADVDVEMAVFEADRGNAARAFMLATKAYRTRMTIFTADAMAWALLRSGRAADAVPYAERAISSDPAIASVHYHAAAVFAATGAMSRAADAIRRASRNPWFSSSQADAAAQLAQQLHVSWPTRS